MLRCLSAQLTDKIAAVIKRLWISGSVDRLIAASLDRWIFASFVWVRVRPKAQRHFRWPGQKKKKSFAKLEPISHYQLGITTRHINAAH